jgi:hypothetical protein
MAIFLMITCKYEDMFLSNVGTHTQDRSVTTRKTTSRHTEFYMTIIYKVYNKPSLCVNSDEQC